MTDHSDTPDDRHDKFTNQSTGPNSSGTSSVLQSTPVSRRSIIGSLLAVGGVAIWRLAAGDSESDPSAGGNESEPDSQTEPNKNDQETDDETAVSPWRYEQQKREQYHSKQTSLAPRFDYTRTTVESDSDDEPIEKIVASPSAAETGDQLLFLVEAGFGSQLTASLVAFSTNSDSADLTHHTEIAGVNTEFDVHVSNDFAIGTASHTPTGRDKTGEEVYIVRGDTAETVRTLIDTYDELYSKL